MRILHFSAIVLLLAPAVLHGASADDIPLAPAVECTPRAGLPDFLAKLAAGKEVRIAYLGGSITAQEGWRPKTLAWFQKNYPKAKLSQINAAIGGTGSDLGVFRLRQDVLDHKPDLLFVEFAVNDGGALPRQIHRCMEGIVRQTWKTLPDCDICYVYTLVSDMAPTLQQGKFPRAASAMENVAAHYGIPSIHMGLEVARMAAQGRLVFQGKFPTTDAEKRAMGGKIVFSPDNVHPYPETGHELYLQSIVRSLPPIRAVSKSPGPHVLTAPLVADNYEQATLVPINKARLSPGFHWLDPRTDLFGRRYAERMTSLHRGSRPGETIEFKFKGTMAAIYDVIGPDCGQVSITLDDQPAVIRPRFDAYCVYDRLQTLPIGSDLPDRVHTVKIEICREPPDKAKILAQRSEKMDNPRRFEGTAFYPGAILVVGKLVE
jgi:lysophospholipase L1-like esterase